MKYKCILLFTILLYPLISKGQCNRVLDSLSLVSLYKASDGENWLHVWDLNQPISTWYGISLNNEGCVHCIDLDGRLDCAGYFFNNIGNNLFGYIPDSLGKLSEVQYISLGNNSLSGSIPSSLGQLSNLIQLILRYNILSGPIPPELGNLQKLDLLNLSYNNLNGEIPEEIGFIAGLSALFLFDNELTGEIPASFENLTLSLFGAANNHLSGEIPPFLATVVSRLELQNNELSGCFPEELREKCADDFRFYDNRALPWLGDFQQFCNSSNQIGAPCDDGNPNTINSIDTNCDCVVTTSLNEISKSHIRIVPNPVLDELTIDGLEFTENIACTIFTFEGKRVKGFESTHLDVSDLTQGIFLLEILDNKTGFRSSTKFAKQ